MNKIVLSVASILLMLLSVSVLQGQNTVTIKGTTTEVAKGKTLDLYAWSDPITNTQVKIASGKIDTSGKFSFSFKSDKTFFAYVKIDFNQSPIYIEPGKTYILNVKCPNCNAPDDGSNPYLDPKDLAVTITNNDSTELNYLVNRFNFEYEKFVWNNYISLIRQRNKAKIDSFRTVVNKHYAYADNEYFSNIIRYRFALIEELAQAAGSEILAKKYLYKQPVLYDNTGYMEFFNEFFKDYLTSVSKYITSIDLYKTINDVKKYTAFNDTLGKDTILKNEVVREMVALKGLGEMYYLQDYDKSSILGMFKYVADNSKFQVHKTIAANYIKLFTKLTPGTVAPAFTLKDYNNQNYSLSEFNKDKYVYLFFWTSWCSQCLSEMQLIGKLKEKYGTKVEFVGISADKEFMTYFYFMQKNQKYNFTTLHWGNNINLLEDYEVKAYPLFVLIGPDSKIVQYPAIAPSEKLDEYFYDFFKSKEKK